MIKRGRKRKNEHYFGPNEEEAVIRFLESTDEKERNQIFNESLNAPLDKMIESIIRRYKLYRKGYTFEELHTDTVSFLMTKVHRFERGLGKKAYSYFGTISKNYILGLLIKDDKHMKQTDSYDNLSDDIENRDDLAYVIDPETFAMDSFINDIITGIEKELDDQDKPPKKRLNENERKVGYALIDILTNWEKTFEAMEGGSKYNKTVVLETMRNYTNLSTKDIRLAMKRYKVLYDFLKNSGLAE